MSRYAIPMPELDRFHKKTIIVDTLGTIRSFNIDTLLELYLDNWLAHTTKYGASGLDPEVECIVNVCFNNCFRA